MKIKGGRFQGIYLKAPRRIRATESRVKEALFNFIKDKVATGKFLDLCSGSGQIGLEALSYGAEEVVFVENSPYCIKVIKDNIRILKQIDSSLKTRVFFKEASEALRVLRKYYKFEIIFFDPPYRDINLAKKILKIFPQYDILTPNGIFIYKAWRKTPFEKMQQIKPFQQRVYGDSLLLFYRA